MGIVVTESQHGHNQMFWDFDTIESQINRGVAGERDLSPATLVLCLSALTTMDNRNFWGIDDLTDVEWDTVDAWLSTAFGELLTEVAGLAPMTIDEWYYTESSGTNGVATSAGAHTIMYNNANPNNEGNVAYSSGVFTPDVGTYLVSIYAASNSQGYGRVCLYDDDNDETVIIGTNEFQPVGRTAEGLIVVETGNYFYSYTLNTDAGYLGRFVGSTGLDECYARIIWKKLSD